MKKILSAILVFILVFSLPMTNVYAESQKTYDGVKAKNELVKLAEQKVKSGNIIKKSTGEINQMLLRLASEGVSEDTMAKEMEKYGVFKLNTPKEQMVTLTNVDQSDISMSTPMIYYDSNTSEWVVVGGGYWITNDWLEHVPSLWPGLGLEGEIYNVGNTNGFGVGYTSTSGTYNSKVNSVYAYMSDGEGHEVYTTVRADGDGSKGFGFRLQDYIRLKKDMGLICEKTTEYFSYIGKHFAGLARYDSKFSSYDGVATSYFVHTYSSASISSVKFGVSGKTAGIDFTITNEQYSFPAFSNDARF